MKVDENGRYIPGSRRYVGDTEIENRSKPESLLVNIAAITLSLMIARFIRKRISKSSE